MEVKNIIERIARGEELERQEMQWGLTKSRHIKIRKGVNNYGERYKHVSELVYTMSKGQIKVPTVIENGMIEEYEYIIQQRVVPSRTTSNKDIEKILRIMENIEGVDLMPRGPMIEKPVFLSEERNITQIKEKLKLINIEDEEINEILDQDTEDYTLQHGDLRHRNIIIKNNDIYLVDLDTVGIYPHHFERYYITSELGIPISTQNIPDKLIKREYINKHTINIQEIIEGIKKRIELIKEGRTSGLSNISQEIVIHKKCLTMVAGIAFVYKCQSCCKQHEPVN